jgi:hypothetical protein
MPDQTTQFWMNWSVNLAVAIGTIGAVIMAVLGEPIRNRIFRPKLKITFDNVGEGYRVQTKDTSSGRPLQYLRIAIENRGAVIAKNVRLLVTRVILVTPNESDRVFESEVLPLRFAFSHAVAEDIPRGPPQFLDVCFVEGFPPVLHFCFKYLPNHFPTDIYDGRYEITVIAVGDNCRTRPQTVRFIWDRKNLAFS